MQAAPPQHDPTPLPSPDAEPSGVVRAGLWGVFGHGNYGNEATLSAFLGQLDPSRFHPTILTINPTEASQLHGIPAVLVGPPAHGSDSSSLARAITVARNRSSYLRGAFRVTRRLDAVVIVGTGGLERTGAFGTPFEIWALALASRVLRRPFLLLDIGVDRFAGRLSRLLTSSAGRLASYRSYRDEASRTNMTANGLRAAREDAVTTDMALSLEPSLAATRDTARAVLGVMDYRGQDSNDPGALDDYVKRCRRVIEGLLARSFSIVIAAGDDDDLPVAHRIGENFSRDRVSVADARTPGELTQLMSGASVVIATRYHTLIMSLLARTPVISLGYSEKHRAMLRQFSLPDAHRTAGTFDPDEIVSLASEYATKQHELGARIDDGVLRARRTLDGHWPAVLGALSRFNPRSR